jgi:HPt (histidine-containing phosphotransfer) domain-containing protein
MDFEKLKQGGIDVDDALVRFSGNRELLEKYLVKFLDDPVYKSIVLSMDAKKWDTAEDSVHSFKGITGSLAIRALFETSCALLEALRVQDYELAIELYENIKVEYAEAASVIKKSQ